MKFKISALFACSLFLLASNFNLTAGQESATTWSRPQQVQRQVKPKRVFRSKRYRTRPKVQTAPLLTVQYRVMIKRPDGSQGESSLASVFHENDLLRLGVTANQDGFLYVVYQKEGHDGQVMFPDSRVNHGENFVTNNQEFILPPIECPLPNPDQCWYKVTDDPAQEFFIIVFSRDQITDLPNTAGRPNSAVKQTLSSGVVKKEIIDDYIRNARIQDYKIYGRPSGSTTSSSRYAVWITNTNRRDNEEIVLRVPLNKGS
ncbi:MAG TPA: DUF4384 domain-containing protein [Pyrinomonadaceae bacterium]|nr:DUF4384 domain-containing protein [Pyrinomonadaceae bacterium]